MSDVFSGKWKNQLGSLLDLQVADGEVSGRLDMGVGNDGEPLWVEVRGRAGTDLITFNAVFPNHGTVVAWVGQHTVEGQVRQIRTVWCTPPMCPTARSKRGCGLRTELAPMSSSGFLIDPLAGWSWLGPA